MVSPCAEFREESASVNARGNQTACLAVTLPSERGIHSAGTTERPAVYGDHGCNPSKSFGSPNRELHRTGRTSVKRARAVAPSQSGGMNSALRTAGIRFRLKNVEPCILKMLVTGGGTPRRSADFQSAVSPISNRPGLRSSEGGCCSVVLAGCKPCDTADWKSALQDGTVASKVGMLGLFRHATTRQVRLESLQFRQQNEDHELLPIPWLVQICLADSGGASGSCRAEA